MGASAASLPESHQGSEVGSQHCPAEGCHGVDPHQAADEGVLAALEQGHNVRTHVVSVLLSEVLNEAEMCMQMLQTFDYCVLHTHFKVPNATITG